MIKINLLESVTEKQATTSNVVNKKVSSPISKLTLIAVACTALFLLVAGWDIVNSSMKKADADKQLANEKEIAAQLESVIKEQTDLDTKIKAIDSRIEAIKKIRSAQAGPSAVLEAVKERIQTVPGLYLESLDQKGDQLTIKGNSPDEGVVTQFGRSLEFSSGLFNNLNIETQRKEMASTQVASADGSLAPDVPKLETVNFTIRCGYSPSKATQQSTLPNGTTAQQPAGQTQPAGQPAQPAQTAQQPQQVAQKSN
jgi:Tfp pilus assembly protein PilN